MRAGKSQESSSCPRLSAVAAVIGMDGMSRATLSESRGRLVLLSALGSKLIARMRFEWLEEIPYPIDGESTECWKMTTSVLKKGNSMFGGLKPRPYEAG